MLLVLKVLWLVYLRVARFKTKNDVFCPSNKLYGCHTQPNFPTQHLLSNGRCMALFFIIYTPHLYVKCRSILVFKGEIHHYLKQFEGILLRKGIQHAAYLRFLVIFLI